MILYLRNTNATVPNQPNSTKRPAPPSTAGVYIGPRDLSLTNGSSPTGDQFSAQTEFTNTFESSGFIYNFDLDRQTLNMNATLDLYAAFTNEIPPPTTESGAVSAALFIWRPPNVFQLGSTDTQFVGTSPANYTLNFGSFSFVCNKCDHLYLEIWAFVNTGGQSEVMTVNTIFNSVSFPGILTLSQDLKPSTYYTGNPTQIKAPTIISSPTQIVSPDNFKC